MVCFSLTACLDTEESQTETDTSSVTETGTTTTTEASSDNTNAAPGEPTVEPSAAPVGGTVTTDGQ